jgi:hypothetical protein
VIAVDCVPKRRRGGCHLVCRRVRRVCRRDGRRSIRTRCPMVDRATLRRRVS